MSDKNFKVKNGIAIQGTTSDTVITGDNNGGLVVGGSPVAFVPAFSTSASINTSNFNANDPSGPPFMQGAGYSFDPVTSIFAITPANYIVAGSAAIFNAAIPNGETFTISSVTGNASGIFVKTGDAVDPTQLGMNLNVPATYVSGDQTAFWQTDFIASSTINNAGKLLTNDGTDATWTNTLTNPIIEVSAGLVPGSTLATFNKTIEFPVYDAHYSENGKYTLEIYENLTQVVNVGDTVFLYSNGSAIDSVAWEVYSIDSNGEYVMLDSAEVAPGDFQNITVTALKSAVTGLTSGTAGQALVSTGTGVEWADLIPAIASGGTADVATLFNVQLAGISYDFSSSPTTLSLAPAGTIDDAAITAFNALVSGNFTITFDNSGAPATTTFTKVGAAENYMGMVINIPVQYVSGEQMFSIVSASLSYGSNSTAGKFLTNDGTTASWGAIASIPEITSGGNIPFTGLSLPVASASHGTNMDSTYFVRLNDTEMMSNFSSADVELINSTFTVGSTIYITGTASDPMSPTSITAVVSGTATQDMMMGYVDIPVSTSPGSSTIDLTQVTINSVGSSTSGKFLTNNGTTASWGTVQTLPTQSLSATTALGTLLNTSFNFFTYDYMMNPTQFILTPSGTIDDAAIAAANVLIPNGSQITITTSGASPAVLTKTGDIVNVMGMQVNIPVTYVSGNQGISSSDPNTTITYSSSAAGKILASDGTNAVWTDTLEDVALLNPSISISSPLSSSNNYINGEYTLNKWYFNGPAGLSVGSTVTISGAVSGNVGSGDGPDINGTWTIDTVFTDWNNSPAYISNALHTLLESVSFMWASSFSSFTVTGTASSAGTAGQVLKSTGTGVEWGGVSLDSTSSIPYTVNYLTTAGAPYTTGAISFVDTSDSSIANSQTTPPVTNGTTMVGYFGSEGGLKHSTDNGLTWSACTIQGTEGQMPFYPNPSVSLGLVYGNGKFVLAVNEGSESTYRNMYTSTDGIQFSLADSDLLTSYYDSVDISFANGYFFRSTSSYDSKTGDESVYMDYSTDAVTWTAFAYVPTRFADEASALIAPQGADHRKEVYYINGQYIWLVGGYRVYFFDTPATASSADFVEVSGTNAFGQSGQGIGSIAYYEPSNVFILTTGSYQYTHSSFYILNAESGTGKITQTSSYFNTAYNQLPEGEGYTGAAIVNYGTDVYLFTGGNFTNRQYRKLSSLTQDIMTGWVFTWDTAVDLGSGSAITNVLAQSAQSSANILDKIKELPDSIGGDGTFLVSNGSSLSWSQPLYSVETTSSDYYVNNSSNNKIILAASGLTVWLPYNVDIGFSLTVIKSTSSAVSFSAGDGASINSASASSSNPSLRALYSSATAIKLSGDTWFVIGDLTQ